MSQEAMVALARQVAFDLSAQPRIEGMTDEELTALGLDPDEIQSIRTGFFDRALQLGLTASDDPAAGRGCCSG